MIAKLIDAAHPLLHRPLKKVNKPSLVLSTKIDATGKSALELMKEALEFTGGIGIAANQIGLDTRLFLIDPEIERQFLKLKKPRLIAAYFNPVIKNRSEAKAFMEEGCLSLPGYRGEVERHKAVTLEYLDFDGRRKSLEATGLLAHIFQHETDHLEGKLYVDRIGDKDNRLYKIKPLKIVFFGSSEFSVPVLEKLISMKYSWEYHVVGVVTLPDRPSQRGLVEKPTQVSILTQQYDIPVFKPDKLKDVQFISQIKSLEPDLIVLASYRKIIPQSILAIPKYGNINIHPSMLPLYRGPSPIQSALLNGKTETGITLMKMSAQVDAGDILSQVPFKILPEDNYASLRDKMSFQAGILLAYTLPGYIAGKIKAIKQPSLVKKLIKAGKIKSEQNLYTKTFTRDDGFVDLNNLPSRQKLNSIIRGLYPWPGVWTRYQNKIVKVFPGRKVQMEGKTVVSLEDFKRGHPDFNLDL